MKDTYHQRLTSSFLPGLCATGSLLVLAGIFHPGTSLAQSPVELKIQTAGSRIEIVWPDKWTSPAGQIQYPVFEVERTVDLKNWQSLGQKFQGSSGSSGQLKAVYDLLAPMAFYPFSGMKDSFAGVLHTQGKEAVRFFTESKVCIHRWFD